jgi:uncharacterized protein (TIGR03435 family)
MKRRTVLVFALCAWSASAADAPRYEVASIRPHDPDLRLSSVQMTRGGEIWIYGMTIRNVIWLAWHLPPERVTGGPKWLDSELYDIRAKPPAGRRLSTNEHFLRIQTLLADRLRLRTHREAKEEKVYFLRVAKTGLRMEPEKSPSKGAGNGSILPWSMIISSLSGIVGRPVIDRTGLNGAWHFGIRYAADDGTPAARGLLPGSDPGPSIFTAVQEQLGLKLDAGKALIDHLVIDSVERPSAN